MVVRIFCDLCNKEIPEESEDEGWDVGTLLFKRSAWGERKALEMFFDYDALCEECTNTLKEAISTAIKRLEK